MQDPCRFGSNEVNDWLVVLKLDVLPFNLLLYVFFLLQLENVLIEEELKRLICIVDAKLLKAIVMEVLRGKKYLGFTWSSLHNHFFYLCMALAAYPLSFETVKKNLGGNFSGARLSTLKTSYTQ